MNPTPTPPEGYRLRLGPAEALVTRVYRGLVYWVCTGPTGTSYRAASAPVFAAGLARALEQGAA